MANTLATAYLFDIDGVLTDPVEKRVIYEEIYVKIIELLQAGESIGFITGRSGVWIADKVISPLLERMPDKSILQGLVAVGEKGGTWMTFDESGAAHEGKANGLEIPEDLKEKVKKQSQGI